MDNEYRENANEYGEGAERESFHSGESFISSVPDGAKPYVDIIGDETIDLNGDLNRDI